MTGRHHVNDLESVCVCFRAAPEREPALQAATSPMRPKTAVSLALPATTVRNKVVLPIEGWMGG